MIEITQPLRFLKLPRKQSIHINPTHRGLLRVCLIASPTASAFARKKKTNDISVCHGARRLVEFACTHETRAIVLGDAGEGTKLNFRYFFTVHHSVQEMVLTPGELASIPILGLKF